MSTHRFLNSHATCTAVSTLRAPLIAIAVAGLLAGCGGDGVTVPNSASNGSGSGSGAISSGSGSGSGSTGAISSGSGSSSGGSGSNSGGSAATTQTSASTSGDVTTLAHTTQDLGSAIGSQTVPGVDPQVTRGVGSAVSSAGATQDALADALSNGLGQIGSTPNPVDTTAAGLGPVVSSTSGIVQGVSTAANGLGSGTLAPLSPATTPLASMLDVAVTGLNAGGSTLGNALSSAPVQQATQPVSTAIAPIVATAGLVTQDAGTATGIGAAVSGELAQVGKALEGDGSKISSSAHNPLGADIGSLVSSLGNTDTDTDGLVNPNGPDGAAPIPGLITSIAGSTDTSVRAGPPASSNPLEPAIASLTSLGLGANPLDSATRLLDGTPLAGPAASLPNLAAEAGALGGSNPLSAVTGTLGGSNPLSAVTGTLGKSNPLSAVTGTLGGSNPLSAVTGTLGGSNPLSAVTGALGGSSPLSPVTGALGGPASGSAGGQLLAPVTALAAEVAGTPGATTGSAGTSSLVSGLTSVVSGLVPTPLK